VKRILRVFALALSMLLPVACAQGVPGLKTAPPAAAQAQTPEARMHAAEARYRQALVLIENGNPEGVPESDAALEDMEDALHACNKAPDCAIAHLLASYKRLLKLEADDGLGDESALDDGVAASAQAQAITDASTVLQPDE